MKSGLRVLRPLSVALLVGAGTAMAQTAPAPARPARPTPPTRDAHSPGYVEARELPDGTNPAPNADGNFIIGSTHNDAPETVVQVGVPQGDVFEFTMRSEDSKIYPGIARDADTFGTPDPNDPAKMIVTTSHPAAYMRRVTVYVPKQYVAGTAAPFIVGADGPDRMLFTVLDNLIAAAHACRRWSPSLSATAAAMRRAVSAGWSMTRCRADMRSSLRRKCCRRSKTQCQVKLTKDPEGRATMGGSSGGSCALEMAWYQPDLYHRVLTYSGTYVNQQWPPNPATPHGAWEFHEHLIPEQPAQTDTHMDGSRRP